MRSAIVFFLGMLLAAVSLTIAADAQGRREGCAPWARSLASETETPGTAEVVAAFRFSPALMCKVGGIYLESSVVLRRVTNGWTVGKYRGRARDGGVHRALTSAELRELELLREEPVHPQATSSHDAWLFQRSPGVAMIHAQKGAVRYTDVPNERLVKFIFSLVSQGVWLPESPETD